MHRLLPIGRPDAIELLVLDQVGRVHRLAQSQSPPAPRLARPWQIVRSRSSLCGRGEHCADAGMPAGILAIVRAGGSLEWPDRQRGAGAGGGAGGDGGRSWV